MAVADYDFNSTRTDLISRALRIVGAIGDEDSPSAAQNSNAVLALNQMVKAWQNEHIFLWAVEPKTQVFTPGVSSYALSTDPAVMWIDRAFYRDSSSRDTRELEVISYREYAAIIDKTTSGSPTQVALDNEPNPTMYLWPVPNDSNSLYYEAVERLQDFNSSSGTGGFDPRWGLALTYGLARELAPENGIRGTELTKLENRAAIEFTKAKGGDREKETHTSVRSAYRNRRR